jgi:6-phosphogluconolactonase
MTNPSVFSRRSVLGASAFVLTAWSPAKATPMLQHLFVGTFNTPTSKGIYPLTYDPASDRWTLRPPVETVEEVAFDVRSPRFGLHYVAEHKNEGRIAVYRASPDASQWELAGAVPTLGSNTTYITLNRAETAVVAANYNSGNIVLYQLDPATGLPTGKPESYQDKGYGPVADRQAGPHAHWVRFSLDQRALYAIDLGTDEILAYRCTPEHATLADRVVAYKAPPGTGPRHMVFHPQLARTYLVSELNNTVTVLERKDDAVLVPLQKVSVLPEDFAGHSQASHIEINQAGTRLYISNRGHNSIAVFAIGADGKLTLLGHYATQGDWPRFLLLLEEFDRLLVANERSGELVPFRITPDGLEPAGPVIGKVPEAVFIGAV